jgi:oligopeptide/dipeptide ABC transporter ATP-binding protein
MKPLLDVRGLTVELPTEQGWVRPVNDVSLHVGAGECLGLVGESGSGKTMLSLALMGLLPTGARVAGKAWLGGAGEVKDAEEIGEAREKDKSASEPVRSKTDLVTLGEEELRTLRGREIAMIFQEPMTSLNPVLRVGAQVEEAIEAHYPKMAGETVRKRMLDALRLAAVPEPGERAKQYPHQLSGGLRQRVMIAMAIAAGLADSSREGKSGSEGSFAPRLLIADEPTTALDVTVQKEILELLQKLRGDLGLGLLFITHDLGVVAQVADRVAVMYAGRVVEEGPAQGVLSAPRHPYTQGLLAASPKLARGKLTPIPGSVPKLTALPPGCAFEPRCGLRRAECSAAVPDLRTADANHSARCVLVG